MTKLIEVLGDKVILRLTSNDTNSKYSVLEFETPEGVGQPPHSHNWDETYIVVEGELDLNVNGVSTVVSAGRSIDVPAGTIHAPISKKKITRYVMVAQPGGVESVFTSLEANSSSLDDMERVVEIVTKEGVNIAM
ncbi:cupin domain-containing protein [Prochlorococcus sp. MIT 1341]|uniref:cupin domain-containing protein n=1 Tax=Prochlorococcus sp. MIT 1341 TaxID=3096221 RepID=UPI002A750081|nr:cupin domain-containing protein [Prochlorococcus sp. MIT 1341]